MGTRLDNFGPRPISRHIAIKFAESTGQRKKRSSTCTYSELCLPFQSYHLFSPHSNGSRQEIHRRRQSFTCKNTVQSESPCYLPRQSQHHQSFSHYSVPLCTLYLRPCIRRRRE